MKPKFLPKLDVSIDERTGTIRSAYLRIRRGTVHETREISAGSAFADYDKSGLLLGIELLGPCDVKVLDRLSRKEPDKVKRFVLGSPPRELVSA